MSPALLLPVMLAAPAAGTSGARPMPRFTLEEAVATRTLGHFALSSDGRRAAFTVAGFSFGFPVIPRFGEDNNLRVVALETGEITQVTTGPRPKTQPRFSPDGARVAFESEDDVWVAEVATGAAWRVTTNGARDEDAAWSPDGRRLAFVSNRGGRTDLWIAPVEGERHGLSRLTDDGAGEDDPQWSPDGAAVAFTARRGDEHYFGRGLFRIDVASKSMTRLTPADSSDNAGLRFSPDGRRLAWISDRNGYMRVWIAGRDGSSAREVNTGPHDAASPHWRVAPRWSPDGRRILVSLGREGAYDLALIDAESATGSVVRGGGGQHHALGFGPDGALVYVHESPASPPDLFAAAAGRPPRRLTHSAHAAFRPEHFAERRRVAVRAGDGFESRATLLTPRAPAPGERLPAIVNLHPNSYGQFFEHWSPFFEYLAVSGYAVLNLDQRGSSGYGRAYRDAAVGQWGTGTLDDVLAAARFLKQQPFVDPDRVGVMGLSFGGYLTLLALVREPEAFAAGIDLMGVADRRGAFGGRNFAFHVGKTEQQDPDLYARLSPITQIGALRAPLLILHSDGDRNVPPQQTYNLVDELQRRGKPFESYVYPGEAHGLADPAHQIDAYRRILAFFDRHLKRPGGAPAGGRKPAARKEEPRP